MQISPIVRARRAALREAQTWLLQRAQEMNDPHARQILNAAASAFGAEKLRGFVPETAGTTYVGTAAFDASSTIPATDAPTVDGTGRPDAEAGD